MNRLITAIVAFGAITVSVLAQEGAPQIAANELIEMMTSLSGPLSERPFVPPVTHQVIGYGTRASRDPVAQLIGDIGSEKIRLEFESAQGYLRSLLRALHISVESQM